MRWRDLRRSENVEDLRGRTGGLGRGGVRVGGVGLLVMLLVAWFLGANPLQLLALLAGGGGSGTPSDAGYEPPSPAPGGPPDEGADFVSAILADTEDTWSAIFQANGRSYEVPRLVLFTDVVRSACGTAQSAMGPFYCPLDRKVYIDLGFYRDLRERFGAPGDFAQAYVIAHEIGHHVQNLLGIADRVQAQREQAPRDRANALSVSLELQADCLAGVWANHAQRSRQLLEEGDVEEGLRAAAAIGDDRIQRQTQGYVVPEAFTHGSSEQRVRWFRRGIESGDVDACDTFGDDRS
ncbi:MAG TPA: neutral zinc metallopeptidase [Myxococcota bacterium]|nr:neutral zinc metallopeptidase [Myxococcota bacterium]